MTENVFSRARLVLPDRVAAGSLLVRDGRIADLDEGRTAVSGLDLDGDFLLPGLVETHTDHLEKHLAPRPGVRWDTDAAVLAHDAQVATAGITTVLDALRIGSHDDSPLVRAARGTADAIDRSQRAGRLRADHHLHLRCEVSDPGCGRYLAPFEGDPLVRLVSLMDHAPGQRQYADPEVFRTYHLGTHAVAPERIDEFARVLVERSHQYAGPNRALVADFARRHDVPIASHDDATREHVTESITYGTSIAEFPTTLEAARAAHAAGLLVVMGAPNLVCGGSQSGNVAAEEVLADGQLDILSSDYVPASPLQAVFWLAARRTKLPDAVRMVSGVPARAVGLTDRGALAPGLRADLVRVRLSDRVPVVCGVWRTGKRVA